jgi:hypothetical protein
MGDDGSLKGPQDPSRINLNEIRKRPGPIFLAQRDTLGYDLTDLDAAMRAMTEHALSGPPFSSTSAPVEYLSPEKPDAMKV